MSGLVSVIVSGVVEGGASQTLWVVPAQPGNFTQHGHDGAGRHTSVGAIAPGEAPPEWNYVVRFVVRAWSGSLLGPGAGGRRGSPQA